MKLEGIKANFLGDSITAGVGVPDVKYAYLNVLKDRYGLAVARNYGISGTRIARQQTPYSNPSFDRDFCSRVDEMDPDADLVVVFGGTNDFGHGDAPFGTPDDRTVDTFCGACHVLMRSLVEKFPAATVVFMTPLHRAVEQNPAKPCLAAYVHAIKETAEVYGIPVFDLYANAGINPQIPAQRELYAADGLHPTVAGAARIAERLGNFLLSL